MAMKEISIGQRFGMLKVIGYGEDLITSKGYLHKRYLCRCECGREKLFTKRALTIDKTQSCGCLVGKKFKNLEGLRFERLKAISIHHIDENGCYWNCECECGNTTVVRASSLILGDTKSCGCLRKETLLHETHGLSGTRLYRIWEGMRGRCNNQNLTEYERYGGRGITICEEWLGENGFQNFYDWSMANGYSEELSIDRIDNNGNYEPSNCRWVDMKVQANNRRTNAVYEINGEKHNISEWSEITKIPYSTLRNRFVSGWNLEEAIKRPVEQKYSHKNSGRRKK